MCLCSWQTHSLFDWIPLSLQVYAGYNGYMSRGSTVILERRFVPKGTLIMEEGEPGNCAYLIQSGVVEVYTENEGREVSLAKLDLGQIFGEMALIFDELRTASVRALEDCNLIVITRQSFQAKLGKTDPTIAAIVKMLTQRVISANNTLVNKKSDVKDLVETTEIIYDNILSSLPRARQRTFQASVLPKLEEFLKAVDVFEERYS
mgnify:CR=1 FL=1